VAVKAFSPNNWYGQVGDEAWRRVAAIIHAGIASISVAGEDAGVFYLVREFVPGRSLADLVPPAWPDAAEAVRLVVAIANALHYAHERGVVHGDLKLSNIILDPAGSPRLTDFHLFAWEGVRDRERYAERDAVGFAYWSPEQARGEAIDRWSDVYSLGVLLYVLLTGEVPFRTALGERPSLPRDLAAIRQQATAHEPGRRYQTAAEMAADLERYLYGEPVRARPAAGEGEGAALATTAQGPRPALPRILIAATTAELLEAYLGDSDYELRTAADGEETLRQVRDWQPDLILLDIMMPKISGFEVCKRLRADPQTRDIAVLMVTGLDQPSDMDKAVEAGTDDYVTKPIKKPELMLRVGAMLAAKKHKPELDRALAYIEAVEPGGATEGVRPSNILLGPGGRPCVTDFGLARHLPPRDIRRYSDISFPPRVRVGKPTNLRVRIATSRRHAHDAELALEFPVGAATLPVTVFVAAENLTVESDPRATLLVPREGDSPAVQFRLVGERVGPGRVMIDFDQDGRPVGSVDLAVEVGGQTDKPAPAPAVEVLLSGGQLPAPDVTLTVHEYRHWPGRLHFTLFSRHPRLRDLPWVNHGDLGTVELRQETIGWVERQLALTNDWGEVDRARRLADLGNSLHDQVLPERLQTLCWPLAECGVRSLLVLSDEPHVPWELVKPYRRNRTTGRREEQPFWGETFALARWLRGPSMVDRFGLGRVSAVVSGAAPVRNLVVEAGPAPSSEGAPPAGPAPALPGVEEELRAVRQLEGHGVEVRVLPPRRREVLAAFEEGGFDVLHVACHGSFAGRVAADASALLLEDGTLRAADLAPRLAAALRATAPLVFLNACQTGQVGYSLTRLGGWGAELIRLGCGAFVGTQWRVTDQVAVEVAREFYQQLVKGVPIAGALRAARDHARARFPQDPTWLAYTCFADPNASVWPLPAPQVEQVPCPYCKALLRTARARQCFECGMDWHDPDNVVCQKRPPD
jgi:CheY-like chemotaxis protein